MVFTGNDLTVFFTVIVALPEFFHRPVFERALIIEDELFPIVCCKRSKCDVCHVDFLLNKNTRQHKAWSPKPNVPSSLDILSDRWPAKQKLYDPLRYSVLSSDDRYWIVFVIIA